MLKKQLVFVLLVSISLCQSVNFVRLQKCCPNTIRFAPGFVNTNTDLAQINLNLAYTYKFTGLPTWIEVSNNNTLSGQPPAGLVGATKVGVSYYDRDTKLGQTSFTLIVGVSQKNNEFPNNTNGVYFTRDYATSPFGQFNFIAIYPYVSPDSAGQLVAKGATLSQANINSALSDQSTDNTARISKTSPDATSTNNASALIVGTPLGSTNNLTTSVSSVVIASGNFLTQTVINKPGGNIAVSTSQTIIQPNITSLPLEQNCKNYGTLKEAQSKVDELNKKSKESWNGLQKTQKDLEVALARRDTLQLELNTVYNNNDNQQQAASARANLLTHQRGASTAGKLIDQLTKKINDSQSNIVNLTAKRDELAKQQQGEADAMRNIFRSYQQYEQDLQQLSGLVQLLQANLSSIASQLQMNELARVYNQQRVAQARRELDAALKEQSQIKQGTDQLNVLKNDTQTRLKENQNKLQSLSEKSNALRASLMPTRDSTANYNTQIANVAAQIDQDKAQLAYVQFVKATHEANIKQIQSNLDNINRKISAQAVRKPAEIQDDLTIMSAKIANLSQSAAKTKDDINNIESSIASATSFISINYNMLQKCDQLSNPVKASPSTTPSNATASTAQTTPTAPNSSPVPINGAKQAASANKGLSTETQAQTAPAASSSNSSSITPTPNASPAAVIKAVTNS